MNELKVSDFILQTYLHHRIKQPPCSFAAYFLGALAFGASTSTNSSWAKLLVLIPE